MVVYQVVNVDERMSADKMRTLTHRSQDWNYSV